MTEASSHACAALAAIQAAFIEKYPGASFHVTTGECVARYVHAWREFRDGWTSGNTITIHGITYDAPNIERVITELRVENANVSDQHEQGAQRLQEVERQLAVALEALAGAQRKKQLADIVRSGVLTRWVSVPSSIPQPMVDRLGKVVERELSATGSPESYRRVLREVLHATVVELQRPRGAEERASQMPDVPATRPDGAAEGRLILPLYRPWNLDGGEREG